MKRREFMMMSGAALAAPSLVASRALASDVPVSVAGYRLDRTAALFDGTVAIDGVKATFVEAGIGDMNTLAFSGEGPHQITEVGLHPFMLAHANEGFRDYALLPVFLLRQFRHKSIFVHADAGIAHPEDLKGRRVGTPGYSSTSLTWIRGLLEDEYGVKPEDMTWVISNKDSSAAEAGKISAQEQRGADGVDIISGPAGMDESELLLAGEVDALIHAATPAAYLQGDPWIKRLFPDVRRVEQDYFRRTGVFPIMHVLSIRRDFAEAHPDVPMAAVRAFSQAKEAAYATKTRLSWATDMLPWYASELEATQELMGRNFYPYGIEANRKTLETLFRYSHQQGLASRELTIEELFLPDTLEFSEA
ncbi:ABC transporter substrate-binding protein [Shimia aestuarii]|uniref:4,5-dihydroxyphthalate decarboxylase n=1 Tax=Shimia aestuarii TaxID=254406 RepID=A0A1I4QV08_9RHOB|nr:ABC transporter substrate-binding protein [Shimia aestuarii]SFM43898.1 4,5-dihydroxyphthalate decarboxylase [Shimia aestuarii]